MTALRPGHQLMGTLAELQRVCVITHGSWANLVKFTADGQRLDATVASLHKQHTLLMVTSGKQVLSILATAEEDFMGCGTPLQNVTGMRILQSTAAPAMPSMACMHVRPSLRAFTGLDHVAGASDLLLINDAGKFACVNTTQLLDLVFISANVAGLAPKYESSQHAPALELMQNMRHFLEPLGLEISPSLCAGKSPATIPLICACSHCAHVWSASSTSSRSTAN